MRDLPHDDSHIEGLDEPPGRKSRLYTTAEYAALRDELAAAVAAREAAEVDLARLREALRQIKDVCQHVNIAACYRVREIVDSALAVPSVGERRHE